MQEPGQRRCRRGKMHATLPLTPLVISECYAGTQPKSKHAARKGPAAGGEQKQWPLGRNKWYQGSVLLPAKEAHHQVGGPLVMKLFKNLQQEYPPVWEQFLSFLCNRLLKKFWRRQKHIDTTAYVQSGPLFPQLLLLLVSIIKVYCSSDNCRRH